ncbi:MAG TPA: CPBP family intramembrane glutamic endopeptidase [Polyangiaceae bacterium]|nr:CPBP family intramembrane glutamic endopeptidase [Polyangiaceae bacterium]
MSNVGRRRSSSGGAREATGRKATGGKLLLAFIAVVFAWQTVSVTGRLLQRVSRLAEQRANPARVVVPPVTFQLLELASMRQAEPGGALSPEGQALLDRAAERVSVGESERDHAAWSATIRSTFAQHGLAGFHASVIPEGQLWPTPELWYSDAGRFELLKPLAVVAFFLALAQVLQHVAGSDEDLARVGPGLEWLFSFPVRARALFLARAVAAPLTSPLCWLVLFPFYAVVFCCSGQGALGVLPAAGAAAFVALLGGGLRVLLETTLRRALSPVGVSRVQAILLAFSLLPLAAGYSIAFSPVTSGVLDWARGLSDTWLYAPLTLPLAWAGGGARALGAGLVALGALGAWLALCVSIAERVVRDGVTTGAGEHAVVRGGIESQVASRPTLLHGIVLKEWRSLLRDRRTRAQALFAPLLMFGMQFVLNPSLTDAITSNPRHTATAAFAVSAFSLTTSAFTVLSAEGPAMYWLYLAPVSLARALIQKLWVRGLVSAAFGLLVFVVAWVETPAIIVESLPYAALAFFGIALYAVIAVGIGTLGTDVLEPEPRRRVRPGGMYLFMLLAALFAHAIYTPAPWTKVVQVALSALLAFAVWQKLLERLPYLLDPTEAPPPSITVADGVMAALAFFVLQSLLALPFSSGDRAPALTLLVTFVGAGCLVALVALLVFRKNRVPHLMQALGLRRRPEQRQSLLSPIGLGIGSGALAALLALGYLWVARHVPSLESGFDEAQQSLAELDAEGRRWMLLVSVLAAPVFEEFIFRGILYRGFRRSVRAPIAVAASALVFALVHPAATALPIFVMAVLAASAYERTGWLATPVAAHMTYNAIVFGSALLR